MWDPQNWRWDNGAFVAWVAVIIVTLLILVAVIVLVVAVLRGLGPH